MSSSIDDLLNAMLQETEAKVEYLPLALIRPNPYQPRIHFSDEALDELARSIQTYGVIQPIVVRRVDDMYELVAGERRLRAAQRANIERIPALIRTLSDAESMEIALLENLQREQLSSIEEAKAYDRLIHSLQLSQQQLSDRIGKSRSHIANHLRLLQLPEDLQRLIDQGRLTMGHGRMLLRLPHEFAQREFALRAVKEKWSVRLLDEAVTKYFHQEEKKQRPKKDIYLAEVERTLTSSYEVPVTVTAASGKGRIEFHYENLNELNELLKRLYPTSD